MVINDSRNSGRTIASLQAEIAGWIDQVHPDRTLLSIVAKLLGEAAELLSAETEDNPLEIADCAILILDYAHLAGIDLEEAILAKLEINRCRRWRIAPTGAMQHEH